MLNNTEQKITIAQTRARLVRRLDEQIDFIDLELSWVSSDSVADSLETQKRALLAKRFRLNIPVSR